MAPIAIGAAIPEYQSPECENAARSTMPAVCSVMPVATIGRVPSGRCSRPTTAEYQRHQPYRGQMEPAPNGLLLCAH
ncbi:hypothetical protein Raf01_83650 [Rugosimonospora africana]|uniref:Uncharacterized protein n=1 Tax=Rugosimonospora africana TaxID=556532 RepID=A0A8J3R0D5_9ACTN|nr:hypothetical protein Raf01_83650 [Rugosimonospora africana]